MTRPIVPARPSTQDNPMRPPRPGLAIALLATGCLTETPAPLDSGAHPGTDAAAEATVDAPAADARPALPRCPNGVPLPYPGEATEIDTTLPLPALRFDRAPPAPAIDLADLYTPCAASPRLLVLRVMAAWSGPARWHAAHTARLRGLPGGTRLHIVDLLVRDEDNAPPDAADLDLWASRYDRAPDALALDPSYRFQTLFFGGGRLPVYLLVDPRTMRVSRTLVAPEAPEVDDAIAVALAQLDGLPRPALSPVQRIDNRFTFDQWEQVVAMAAPPRPPPDPTNRWSENTDAARLGAALFADPGLSRPGTISCASCHDASREFTDGHPQGIGIARGDRNTPSIRYAAHLRWHSWDGRADTLWAQALGPIENPVEMDGSRLAVAHRIATTHREAYTTLFGPLPPLEDTARFPPHGRPGQPAWEAMRPDDRAAINRVFVHAAKAIAAFERTLPAPETAFDRYARGQYDALPTRARDGILRWFDFGCIQCHHGPLLTDQAFHNIGMGTGRRDGQPDPGRFEGFAAWLSSPFRADGDFSDAPRSRQLPAGPPQAWMLGAFRTPPLRGVSNSGPWGHGGTFTDLNAVMLHYAQVAAQPPRTDTTGTLDLHLGAFHMDTEALGSLRDFLVSLSPR